MPGLCINVKFAHDSAEEVEATSASAQDISRFFGPKRKNVDSAAKPPKKSKAAVIDELEASELADSDGLEKEYQQSYVGMANIPLDNISISICKSTLPNEDI